MPLTTSSSLAAQQIREATAMEHRSVEELLLPQLQNIRTVGHYAHILKTFYGFFAPVEEDIHAYITCTYLPDIQRRRSTPALLADLQTLHVPAAALPLSTTAPAITNLAEAFGAMYVLEGSTLGGRVISRLLARNTAVPPEALRFFSGYGEETGSMWTAFLHALNQQPDAAAMAAAANDTFYHLKNWMHETLPHEQAA